MKKTKRRKILPAAVLTLLLAAGISLSAQAASLWDNPGVTWAPSGKAFTTDAGERNYTAYPKGTTVYPGGEAGRTGLEKGQHYYESSKTGDIPVQKWEVTWTPGKCVHSRITEDDFTAAEEFGIAHRLQFCTASCGSYYKPGWIATCADCGETIPMLFYMDEDTAQGLSTLPAETDYYYLCPVCSNLEMGAKIKHKCRAVSWNQYYIKYDENSSQAEGYMAKSTFMYNDEPLYEGKPVTPETRLKECAFTRKGYVFTGWNTEPDGSGRYFSEETRIYNLTDKNKETIVLYAQWEKCGSTLRIDPAGGAFDGLAWVRSYDGESGSTFRAAAELVIPPEGVVVSFETDGGTEAADLVAERYFVCWQRSVPFYGTLEGEVYTYGYTNRAEDILTAQYGVRPVCLPETQKEGFRFSGWYKDPECTVPAGDAGEEVLITEDTVLYAGWVSLRLTAEDNYTAFDGSGAVDLSWIQTDTLYKTYRLYQSRDGSTWSSLCFRGNTGAVSVAETFAATGREETYTVPYTGRYTLTLTGAAGEDWEEHTGGGGGQITASVWLSKGEVLTYQIGTSAGYNGGGEGAYGNGGGMTSISSDRKGLLLIAGGGGGATPGYDGYDGGLSQSVTDSSRGESGAAGGGGGWQGGTAGEGVPHRHTGSPDNGTGCYTTPVYGHRDHTDTRTAPEGCYTQETTAACAGHTCTHKVESHSWYCNQCGGASTIQGTRCFYDYFDCSGNWHRCGGYTYSGTCTACGVTVAADHRDGGCGRTCGAEKHTCTLTVYSCPLQDTVTGYSAENCTAEYDGAYPGFGGSNYINEAYCTLKEESAGAGRGDGCLQITLEKVQYMDGLQLKDVAAPDEAAPAMVAGGSVRKTSISGTKVRVTWAEPEDYGTDYYHRAESYHAVTGQKLCDSNITLNHLISGIKGYYYVLDTAEETSVTAENGVFLPERELTVALTEQEQYLHLAACDRGGNLSESLHIRLDKKDPEVAWNLYTEPLVVEGTAENVYPAEAQGDYYVRADGATPFAITAAARMDGVPTAAYQINYMDLDILRQDGAVQYIENFIPSAEPVEGTHTTAPGEIQKGMDGAVLLDDGVYTEATRRDGFRHMTLLQHFLLAPEQDGAVLTVIPTAGALQAEKKICSDREADEKNQIRIIADGRAPEVSGTALLEGEETDWLAQSIPLDLTCSDEGSGVGKFYVTVENRDNYLSRTFYAAPDGHIRLDVAETADEVFRGDFTLTIHAVDNVGNDSALVYRTEKFTLTASVRRTREPHDATFKRGDGGILHIETTGYVERIVVEALNPVLPHGLTFEYENPEYLQQEDYTFIMPLDAPEGTYRFQVYAYKNGKQLNAEPALCVIEVSGTILDEFRRKINWN